MKDFEETVLVHMRETTHSVGGSTKKSSGIGRWVLGTVILALVIVFGQMHQRDKVDRLAVQEGKISAVTIK